MVPERRIVEEDAGPNKIKLFSGHKLLLVNTSVLKKISTYLRIEIFQWKRPYDYRRYRTYRSNITTFVATQITLDLPFNESVGTVQYRYAS